METPINWKDDYFVSKDRIVLTNHELKIPGIRLFATHKIQNAILPLLPHYHENCFEFTFVVKGSMFFYTAKKEYTVSGGSVFVSFPDEVHSTNDIPISLNHQYWMQVDISNPKEFLFLNEEVAEELIQELYRIDKHVIPTNNKEIRSIIEKAFELTYTPGNRLLIASYISIFLQLLINHAKESRYHGSPDIETAIDYIHAHITEELTLDELADTCSLSTSQFKQKFRQIVGISPRNYINQEKIEFSKKLLRQGYPITDVAMQLGFNSSSYFSTVFKKYTMEMPKEYAARYHSK
jgi:AraC-like DNA-binding protein